MQFDAPYRLLGDQNIRLHLHPLHYADLLASGLTDKTMMDAGAYSIRPSDIAHFFGRKGPPAEIISALCFPYQGGSFARIKLFPTLGTRKYSQPPNTGARLYAPFPVRRGPLAIVEGEKKTLAAHQARVNAVGIGGLWNWVTHGRPIDDLNLINWDDREVTIIPDSDVWIRQDLLRAVYALGIEVQQRGASVYVAELTGDKKVGLDDYLKSGGKVSAIPVFALLHKVFRGCRYWHGQWKFRKVVEDEKESKEEGWGS